MLCTYAFLLCINIYWFSIIWVISFESMHKFCTITWIKGDTTYPIFDQPNKCFLIFWSTAFNQANLLISNSFFCSLHMRTWVHHGMWRHRRYEGVRSRSTCAWRADDLSPGPPQGVLSAAAALVWPYALGSHPGNAEKVIQNWDFKFIRCCCFVGSFLIGMLNDQGVRNSFLFEGLFSKLKY